MKIKGAIFDMDGTLLDSMFIWNTMGSRYLKHKGLIAEEGLDAKFKLLTMEEAAEYFRTHYGLEQTVAQIVDEVNKMTEHDYTYEVKEKEGIKELLELLRKKGIKMCVATVTDRYLAEIALKQAGLRDYFEEIFTCAEVGASKHNPKIYENALAYLGTKKEETPVFEDAYYALKTAKQAGFPCVAIYDKGYQDKWPMAQELADINIVSYQEELDKIEGII